MKNILVGAKLSSWMTHLSSDVRFDIKLLRKFPLPA